MPNRIFIQQTKLKIFVFSLVGSLFLISIAGVYTAQAADETLGAAVYACCFRVVGVASNDTLNMRAAPARLDTLVARVSPYATGIRVANCVRAGSRQRVWCEIMIDGTVGWVAGRFLKRTN